MDSTYKLLIIDDDQSDQLLMSAALKRAGFKAEIDVANTADEGIRKAILFNPDMIVLDNSMPGIDGLEACTQLRVISSRLKIIVCSGTVDEAIAARAMSAGADRCCLKTPDYGMLIHAIHELAANKN